MPEKIKRMDVKEFRKLGYLQELNRQFLHPLGLALEVIVGENGDETIGGIWDFRDDPEGIYFDVKNIADEQKKEMKTKADYVHSEFIDRLLSRKMMLGFKIEPLE